MAFNSFEQRLVDQFVNTQFPDPAPEPDQAGAMPPGMMPGDIQVAEAGSRGLPESAYTGQTQAEVKEIPRNKLQQVVGKFGELLQSGADAIDFDVIGLPGVGTLSLKDLTVGDLGKVLQDISYGFYPISGGNVATGGIGTFGLKDEAIELLNAPVVFSAGKTGAKMLVKGAKALAPIAPKNLPVGASTKVLGGGTEQMLQTTKQTAPVSGLGFYSAVEDAALNIQRKSGTGQAMLNDITKAANVKADEIKWIGLDEFLKGKKNVTREEVQEFIRNNRVDVQEVTLGGAEPFDAQRLSQLESEYKALKQHPIDDPSFGEEKYDEMIRLMNIRDQSTTQSLYDAADQATRSAQRAQQQGNRITAEKYFREAELLNTRAEKLDLQGQGMSNPPKFGAYTLPGGENYREILLTMPTKFERESASLEKDIRALGLTQNLSDISLYDLRQAGASEDLLSKFESAMRGSAESSYYSGHWDQPNVLAHIRVNDRVDADGKKMLLVEEVQSDWHQAGRDKGYATADINTSLKESEKELEQIGLQIRDLNNRMASLSDSQIDEFNKLADERQKLYDRQGFLIDEGNALIDKRNAGVPDAPMKDTWYQLALKRVLKYAADNGYERVGLTTGARQAERYDLSKQVDEIAVPMVKEDGSRSVRIDPTQGTSIKLMVDKDGVVTGYGASSTQFSGKKLNEVIGKEMADKVMSAKAETYFSGLDLKVGGEGMKTYYDQIYPQFLAKYGKKWGASVGETKINLHGDLEGYMPRDQMQVEPVRYIDITPEMRQSVSKGQPLFTAIPVGTAATGVTMQDKEQK